MPVSVVQATEPSLLVALFLGLLQGLTEFLPISSSGHLVLAQVLLNAPEPGIALEVILHAGTLLAVLATFRRDLYRMLRDTYLACASRREPPRAGVRQAWLLVLATVPVVIVGLLGRGPIEAAFEKPKAAAGLLIITGLLLIATRFARVGRVRFGARIAIPMGLMQVLSLLPGISRSGATISGGLFGGGQPDEVARFSFLMSVPAVLGSLILQLPGLMRAWQEGFLLPHAAGFVLAFISGLVAIQMLLRVVARGRLFLFGLYCIAAGSLAWILLSAS